MLRAALLRNEASGSLYGYVIQGHAGFGDYGTDIVCAGVSAIAQSALLGLRDMFGESFAYSMRKGFLKVVLDPARALEPGARAILRTLELGLTSIARSYPGSVKVEYMPACGADDCADPS